MGQALSAQLARAGAHSSAAIQGNRAVLDWGLRTTLKSQPQPLSDVAPAPCPCHRCLDDWVCALPGWAIADPVASDEGASLRKVRVQLKWLHQFQFAGFYAAIDQGYFRRAGLEVELLEGGLKSIRSSR